MAIQLKLSMDIMRRRSWKGHRQQMIIRLKNEDYAVLKSAAGNAGKTLNDYVLAKLFRKR